MEPEEIIAQQQDQQQSSDAAYEDIDHGDGASNADSSQDQHDDKPTTMAGFSDALTDDPNAKNLEQEVHGGAAQEDQPGTNGKDKSTEEKPNVANPNPDEKKTPEQEEAELLEGVKSERGKDRIKQVFSERKQLEQDLTEFKQLVQSTGMTPQDFAQSLEYGRLVSSGDENNLRVALEMLDSQRSALAQRLGVEVAGVDLLEDHADLKASVENMELTRDKALELVKYRNQQAAANQQQQFQQQTQQDRQQFDLQVQQAATAMESYLATRANEVDHPVRLKMISEHFQNPKNLQSFIETYQPHQWAATVKMMYDGITVPRSTSTQQSHQPIRSRPANLGTPNSSANDPIDRVAQRMASMNI